MSSIQDFQRVIRASELTAALNMISETRDNTKLKFLLRPIPRDTQHCPSLDLLLVDLEVRERRVELDTPVHKPVRTVDDPLFAQEAEGLDDGL